jgi:hypothetical protein
MTTGNKTSVHSLTGKWSAATFGNTFLGQDPFGTYFTTVGKSWSGSDDLGYKLKINKLESATNAYEKNVTRVIYAQKATQTSVRFTGSSFEKKQQYVECYGSGANSVVWPTGEIDKNTNLAMHSIYAKLNELQSPIGGLEFLGEFMKTVHMIRNPAEALAAYANKHASKQVARIAKREATRGKLRARLATKPRQLGRALKREANEFSKVTAKSILEFNYGAAPLIGLVEDAAQAALKVFPEKGKVKVLRSTFKSEEAVVSPKSTVGFGPTGITTQVVNVYEYSVTIVCRVKYSGQFDGMSELQKIKAQSGLELSKLVPVLWELAPLSVFIDMFAGVGKVLTASSVSTADVVSVDRYVTRKLLRTYSVDFTEPGGFNTHVNTPGLVVTYFYRYTREKWVMRIPRIVFTTPLGSIKKLLNLGSFVRIAFFN